MKIQGIKRGIYAITRGRNKVRSKFETKGKEYKEEVFTDFVVDEYNKGKKGFRDKLGR